MMISMIGLELIQIMIPAEVVGSKNPKMGPGVLVGLDLWFWILMTSC